MRHYLSLPLAVGDSSQVGAARRHASAIARRCGFDELTEGAVNIIVTELAGNLVKHAREGQLVFHAITDPESATLEVLSIDRGPGMADIRRCLEDGFSTTGSPGTGLGAISRLSSFWDAHSARGAGTVQVARIQRQRRGNGLPHEPHSENRPNNEADAKNGKRSVPRFRIGGLSIPAPGETECGDAWAWVEHKDRYLILVVDGLGHGPLAAVAAREAIAVLAAHADAAPVAIIEAAHSALRATRGAAMAVLEIRAAEASLRLAGVGNIAAFVDGEGTHANMVSVNGTVGGPPFKAREFSHALPPKAQIVLFSDGLQTKVRLDHYPQIMERDPSVVAGLLYRDFARGRDDATVVVASLTES